MIVHGGLRSHAIQTRQETDFVNGPRDRCRDYGDRPMVLGGKVNKGVTCSTNTAAGSGLTARRDMISLEAPASLCDRRRRR